MNRCSFRKTAIQGCGSALGCCSVCRKLIAEISELEASPLSEEALDILRSKNKQLEAERDQLAAQNEAMQKALNKIHDIAAPYDDWVKFGYIKELALKGLQLPGLAAEVLKRRDAETLRRAADRFEAVDPHPKHWDWLRRMANEIDGKETT